MKSMTGFAAGNFEIGEIRGSISLKSVNSRNLDIIVKLPAFMASLEAKLVQLTKSRINRGRFVATIDIDVSNSISLQLNKALFSQYLEIYEQAKKMSGLPYSLNAVLQNSELIGSQFDIDNVEPLFLQEFDKVLDEFVASVSAEGESMCNFLKEAMQKIDESIEKVQSLFPIYRERRYLRLKENLQNTLERNLEPDELAKSLSEVAFLMERSDVTEEIERLKHHITTFRENLKLENCGKTLNFVVQEMQREANTMGSKFASEEAFPHILLIKEEIEKCREMVANVE